MKQLKLKDGRICEIEPRFHSKDSSGRYLATFEVKCGDTTFDYDLGVHTQVTDFQDGWDMKDKLDEIRDKLVAVGHHNLERYLTSGDFSDCEKLSDGNYREFILG